MTRNWRNLGHDSISSFSFSLSLIPNTYLLVYYLKTELGCYHHFFHVCNQNTDFFVPVNQAKPLSAGSGDPSQGPAQPHIDEGTTEKQGKQMSQMICVLFNLFMY